MARIIDERGRLFGKINVVDLLVLVVIVALALFVGLRMAWPTKDVPVTITFMVEMYDQSQAEALTTLGPLKDKDGRPIGTIDKVETYERVPANLYVAGRQISVEQTNRPAALVYVSAVAHETEGGLHVGSMAVRVGGTHSVVGPGWEETARVVEVNENPAAAE